MVCILPYFPDKSNCFLEIFSCKELFCPRGRIAAEGRALAFLAALRFVHCFLQFIGRVGPERAQSIGIPFQSGFFLFRFLQFCIEPVLIFDAVLQLFFKPRVLRKERGDLPFVGLCSARLFERFGGGRERCNFARQTLAFAFEFLCRSFCVGLSAFRKVGAQLYLRQPVIRYLIRCP